MVVAFIKEIVMCNLWSCPECRHERVLSVQKVECQSNYEC